MGTYTLAQWSAKLAAAGKEHKPLAERALRKAGYAVRAEWKIRAAAANPTHAIRYPSTIAMRRIIVDEDGVMTVIVEPGGFGQGNLGHILEHGKGGNAAQNNDEKSFAALKPQIELWLGDAMTKPLI